MEIIPDSETQRILGDNLIDYCSVGVEEAWVVWPDAGTVEVLRLTPGGSQSLAVYDDTQAVTSRIFPTHTVPAAEVFAP